MTPEQMRKSGYFRIFASYYRPHIKIFILDMVCALCISLIDLAFPLVSRQAMELCFPNRLFATFFLIMAVMALAYVLKALMNFIVTYWGHLLGVRIEADIRRDLFAHMQDLSFSFYDKNRTGHLMSRVTGDLFEITELAHHGPEDLFISAVTIVGALVVMLTIRWELALILCAIIPLFLLFVASQRKRLMRTSVDVKAKLAGINGELESSISGMRTAKAFANEETEIEKFRVSNDQFRGAKRGYYKSMAVYFSGMEFIMSIMPVVVIATVAGDIHDIGKNLVALMLKNYGFQVIDLGKDVPKEKIIEATIEHNAQIIALSTLMTTTMQEMRNVVEYAKEKGVTAKIMIGGAVITQDYADEIVDYVWEVGQDADGIQRAISYQITPAGIYYRRDIAKEVFGTDDPDEIGKKFADYPTILETAQELKDAGYRIFSSDAEMNVFSGDSAWVLDDTLNVDQARLDYMDLCVELYQNDLTAYANQWSTPWYQAMAGEVPILTADIQSYADDSVNVWDADQFAEATASLDKTEVFAFGLPAWGVLTMRDNVGDTSGKWGVCSGPAYGFDGGTYIGISSQSKRKETAWEFVKFCTLNEDTADWWIDYSQGDTVSLKSALEKHKDDENAIYGGEKLYQFWLKQAEGIDTSKVTRYDQAIGDAFGNAISSVKTGEKTKEDALNDFYDVIESTYPEIKVVR